MQILRGARKDPAFDEAARAAVRQYVFAPARKKGQTVPCWFSVGVPAQIKQASLRGGDRAASDARAGVEKPVPS